MPKHLRVSIGTEEEMQKFIITLEEYARSIEE